MSSIFEDVVSLANKTKKAWGEHLIYSNNGITKNVDSVIERTAKQQDSVMKQIVAGGEKSEEALTAILNTHRPSNFKLSKEGVEEWEKMTNPQRQKVIQRDFKNQTSKLSALKETLSTSGSDSMEDAFNAYRTYGREMSSGGEKMSEMAGIMSGAKGVAGHYFLGSGAKSGAIRMGTAAAGYATAAGTVRYVSGGSMGYNRNGQRDIAGIPFI